MKSKPEQVQSPTDAGAPAYLAGQGGNVESTDVGLLNDAASKRQAILDFLSRHGGSLESAEGRGLTRPMAEAVGYDNLASLNGMLERMVKEGAIERDGSGGRTFRIALVGPRDDPPTPRPPIPEDRAGVADDALAALRRGQQDLEDQLSAAVTTMREALGDCNDRLTTLERSSQKRRRGWPSPRRAGN